MRVACAEAPPSAIENSSRNALDAPAPIETTNACQARIGGAISCPHCAQKLAVDAFIAPHEVQIRSRGISKTVDPEDPTRRRVCGLVGAGGYAKPRRPQDDDRGHDRGHDRELDPQSCIRTLAPMIIQQAHKNAARRLANAIGIA
jgi:hypothetical protein